MVFNDCGGCCVQVCAARAHQQDESQQLGHHLCSLSPPEQGEEEPRGDTQRPPETDRVSTRL